MQFELAGLEIPLENMDLRLQMVGLFQEVLDALEELNTFKMERFSGKPSVKGVMPELRVETDKPPSDFDVASLRSPTESIFASTPPGVSPFSPVLSDAAQAATRPPDLPSTRTPRLKLYIESNLEALLALGNVPLGAEEASSAIPAPRRRNLDSFVANHLDTIIAGARKETLHRHLTGASNFLLDRELPSPFDEVFRSDTLSISLSRISLLSTADKVPHVISTKTGRAIKGVTLLLRIANATRSVKVGDLPLDVPIDISFEFPVAYHTIVFEHIVIELSTGDQIISRSRVPLGSLRPFNPTNSRLSGVIPLILREYADRNKVKRARRGMFDRTALDQLDKFAEVQFSWRFSYSGARAKQLRQGPLGQKGFWHISHVEKWLVDGVAPPAGLVPKSLVRAATIPRDDRRDSNVSSVKSHTLQASKAVDALEADADSDALEELHTFAAIDGALFRVSQWKPPENKIRLADEDPNKKGNALAEAKAMFENFKSGLKLSISVSSMKLLLFAASSLNQAIASLPPPEYVPRETRLREVSLDRVKESRYWLLYTVAAYLKSAATLFLPPSLARKASISMLARFLKAKEDNILLFKEPEGDFTSKWFVAWWPEKKALVISIRGTATLREALTDLNGDYVAFRHGVSHKGFVYSANHIYTNYRFRILDWVGKYRPDRIICTGHSYGGAVATLLSILLRDDLDAVRRRSGNPLAEIEAVVFGPAPTVSQALQMECEHVDSYVNYMDPVPSMSYGSMLDYRELIKEAAQIWGSVPQNDMRRILATSYSEVASKSWLKLEVAGNVWLIRPAPDSPDLPWDDAFNLEEISDELHTAAFPGMLKSRLDYIIEPAKPRDLWTFRFHRDSKNFPSSRPHATRFYGTTLKAVVRTQNSS